MKVFVMGEEVPLEEIPDDHPPLEFHFASVKLSQEALNRASQVVPKEAWRNQGLHAWLQGRANQVFSKLPVNATEGSFGRLKYIFGREGDTPLLINVILK